MNPISTHKSQSAVVTLLAAALLAASSFVHAEPAYFERSLARGAVEDVTPQQKYRTAIREAGGGYKESLRECNQLSGEDRRICAREAKLTYDRDMAEARWILSGRNTMSSRAGG